MNATNLSIILQNYHDKLELINNKTNEEYFKWEAFQHFQKVWATDLPFAEKFKEATSKCSVLLNNGHLSPVSGILKMAEQEPAEVERLFIEVLYGADGGDLTLRQEHMDEFLDGIEGVRQKCFPQFWKYAQNRNIASIYLALYAPEENYIYKYSEAEEFAKYTEFDFDIGSGQAFQLPLYYQLCDSLVDALRANTGLVEEQRIYRKDLYPDTNLHLLAFDVMYCSYAYGLYTGLESMTKAERLRNTKKAKAEAVLEQERQEKRADLENQIRLLRQANDVFTNIILLNVVVTHKQYGTGVIIEQMGTTVTVQFADRSVKFVINQKFTARPTFADDAKIVEACTKYDTNLTRIRGLERELQQLSLLKTLK